MTEKEKLEAWEKLKQRDPLMAELLKQHTKTFGKPESIRVTFKQEKA